MSKIVLVFFIYFSFQNMALAESINKCADLFNTPSIKLITDSSNRFNDPLTEPLISLSTSSALFDALSRGELLFGVSIFNRVIKIPNWLLEKFGDEITEIRVSFSFMNTGEIKNGEPQSTFPKNDSIMVAIRVSNSRRVEIPSAKERELNKMLGGVFASHSFAPLSNIQLVENFLPRSRLYKLIRSAAEKVGGNTLLLEGNRLSKWDIDRGTSQIYLDMSNLSRAEFNVLLNEIALYLDSRSGR